MPSLKMKPGGEIALPSAMRKRYGFTTKTPIRVIETRSGILLVPLTDEPMSDELRSELAEWQGLAGSTWNMFPYEEEK